MAIHFSQLQHPTEIAAILRSNSDMSEQDIIDIASAVTQPIGIKKLLLVLEMVRSSGDPMTPENFMMCLNTVGY